MKKILVIGGMHKGGGISELIYNYYTFLNKDDDVKVEIMVESGVNDFEKELREFGIVCHYVTPLKKNPVKYFIDCKKFLQHNKYDFIHAHVDNLVRFAPYYLLRNSKKNIIIHSHNSFNDNVEKNKIKVLISNIIKNVINSSHFKKIACSKPAAEWLFNTIDNCQIIYNGINLSKFLFSKKDRIQWRSKFNIDDDEKVILHIGRFETQKNHEQLLEIFKELHNLDHTYRLVLVGDGILKEKIVEMVKLYGLQNNVLLIGYSKEISSLLSMSDLMIFPSFYEGFPISLVEAQASGLPIFYSDTITDEIEILSTTQPIDINSDACDIAKEIHKDFQVLENQQRLIANEILKEKGFDIQDTINQIRGLYK